MLLSPRMISSQKSPTFGDRALIFGVLGIGFAGLENLLGDEAGVLADGLFDPRRGLGIVAQECLGILAALAEPLAVVGQPGAGFFDDACLDAEIDQFAHFRNAFAIHN